MICLRQSWCLTKALKSLSKIYQPKGVLSISNQNVCSLYTTKFLSTTCSSQHHVAIVGSGPAGYYTAQQLLKGNPDVKVDIFEKLPVPFGLVRFGVAPDHPEVKNVINTFTTTAHNERCSFFGNIEVGRDVSLNDLQKAYSAVVLCYGASDDRLLGIPGEDLPNVLSARSFVGWYNGLPQDANLPVSLDCESAVILGHGNVALDAARILLSPISLLEKTDICESALEQLRKSRVKRVHLVGRRGPLQVAFTIKELREMIKLPETTTVIQPSDVEGLEKCIQDLPRPRRRLTELLCKSATPQPQPAVSDCASANRECHITFLRTPMRVVSGSQRDVTGVEVAINRLEGASPDKQKAVATDKTEVIECGLVLRSIGYKGLPLSDPVPFDTSRGVIEHENARVKNTKGLYCAGWIKQGPVGVIVGTMNDGFETGKVILSDLSQGHLEVGCHQSREALHRVIADQAITFDQWEKIDRAETEAGQRVGKPREKMTHVEQMIQVAKS